MQITQQRITVTPQATFRPAADGVRAVVQPEGLVLLHVANGMFYRANHVGARIWEKLLAGACLNDVVGQVAEEFGEPPANIAPDVYQFVESLLAQGFVQQENR